MKEDLDRHQERLTGEERRALLADARAIAAKGADRVQTTPRRWALSLSVAVTVIVVATGVLVLRDGRERPSTGGSPEGGRARRIRVYGAIPAGPAADAVVDRAPAGASRPGMTVYEELIAEGFMDTRTDSVSYIAVNIGRGSWERIARAINRGVLPQADEIRIEEALNAFDQGYPEFDRAGVGGADFMVFADGAPAPFARGERPTRLLRIGLKARRMAAGEVANAGGDSVVAEDVRVAVSFDPERVAGYRMLGFEPSGNGRNPPDGGRIRAGEAIAALYEIRLASPPGGSGAEDISMAEAYRLGTVRIQYRAANGGDDRTDGRADRATGPAADRGGRGGDRAIDRPITTADFSAAFEDAPVRLRFDAVVARFAEIMQNLALGADRDAGDLAVLIPIARGLAAELPDDRRAGGFVRILELGSEIATHGRGR
jgi:hypothetical protein